MIKIGIADDHPVITHGVSRFLEQENDMKLLFQVSDGTELLAHPLLPKLQVVLLDIRMEQMGGEETAEKLLELYPHLRIIIISSFKEPVLLKRLIQLGIAGYILKVNCSRELLPMAIRKVMKQEEFFDPSIMIDSVEWLRDPQKNAVIRELTEQHIKIIKLTIKGYTENEIALRLFTGRSNIAKHKRHMQRILHMDSFQKVIAYCIDQQIVEMDWD